MILYRHCVFSEKGEALKLFQYAYKFEPTKTGRVKSILKMASLFQFNNFAVSKQIIIFTKKKQQSNLYRG